jgi:hypothetical protein
MTDQINITLDEFFELLREHVEERIPELESSGTYTLEQVFAKEVWDALSIVERRLVGHYIWQLVKSNKLLLICVGKTGANARLYQLK